MRIPQPSWRGSKVVLATFYMFIGYPLHGIELTEQGVPLGDKKKLYLAQFEWSRHMHEQL